MDAEREPKRRFRVKVWQVVVFLLLVLLGAFVSYRLYWSWQLNRKLAELRKAGYPVTLEELNARYKIPEGEKNAADLMLEAFGKLVEWKGEYKDALPIFGHKKLPLRTEVLDEETKKLIADYLADNAKVLELLEEAGKIKHCRYPADLNQGINDLMMRHGSIRKSCQLLRLSSVLYTETDELNLAVRSVKTMLGVADTLEKAPFLVFLLVRMAVQRTAQGALEEIMNRQVLNEQQLADLSTAFSDVDCGTDFSAALTGEICLFLEEFGESAGYVVQYSIPDRYRFIAVPTSILYRHSGLPDKDACLYIDLIEEYIAATKLRGHDFVEKCEEIKAAGDKMSKTHVVFHFLNKSIGTVVCLQAVRITDLCLARAAIGVERYRLAKRVLPEGLEDLVPEYLEKVPLDAFDGKPLRYKKLEKGFIVYSIGEDEVDDGGMEKSLRRKRRNGEPQYDQTFIVER